MKDKIFSYLQSRSTDATVTQIAVALESTNEEVQPLLDELVQEEKLIVNNEAYSIK